MVSDIKPLPKLPEIGHPESYYVRLAKYADETKDHHNHEALKVGQYITIAIRSKLTWEEKFRYFSHVFDRHCRPPQFADDRVWSFYKDLQKMVRDYCGQEALRLASGEDDRYAALEAMGRKRGEIEEYAEFFFRRLIPTDDCPECFHNDDYRQLKMIRDQWI